MSRYPYTHAADHLRMTVGNDYGKGLMSRAAASVCMAEIAKALGMHSHLPIAEALCRVAGHKPDEETPAIQAPAVSAPAWQPIETAPTDGRTLLLGYFNVRSKWRTVRGQWFSQAEIDDTWEEPDTAEPGWYETVVESDDIPNCWRCHPTHWMPLPAAPGFQAPATADGSQS